MDAFLNAYLSPGVSDHNETSLCVSTLQKDTISCEQKTTTASPSITNLPPEILRHIFKNLSFDNISKLRIVCKNFNEICSSLLNFEFHHLRTMMQQKFQAIKAMMPRRESARRKHPLARESDIVETLHMRLSLLHMTFGKHIERNYCCFFAGEIIDEIYRILKYIKNTPSLNRAYKVTDELFDLSTMAMEYFKERIEPSLPEISYLAHDLWEHTFMSPRSELAFQRVQLTQLQYKNKNKEANQPKTDSVNKFQKQLKSTREMAKKNRHDLIKMKQSLKSSKKRVSAVMKELQEIKWRQQNCKKGMLPEYCKLNDMLCDMKRQKEELFDCVNSKSCSSSESSNSDFSPEKHHSFPNQSTCENNPSDFDKIRALLSKTSTTITFIPLDGSNETSGSSLKVPEKDQLHNNNPPFDKRPTDQQTNCDNT